MRPARSWHPLALLALLGSAACATVAVGPADAPAPDGLRADAGESLGIDAGDARGSADVAPAMPPADVLYADRSASLDVARPTPRDGGAGCGGLAAACTSSANCCSGVCGVEGYCMPPPSLPCSADPDCPARMICQPCNHTCVFRPGGACDLSASCPCDYYCSANACQPTGTTPAAECVFDGDCPNNQFCNRVVFQCQHWMSLVPGSALPCARNTDCPVGEICTDALAPASCAGVNAVVCRTQSDCPPMLNACSASHVCIQVGC
jgi:hypothetical protein